MTSLAPRLAELLGWVLLHSLWQGALLASLLAVVLALLPSASASRRYRAACLALVALPVWMALTGLQLAAAPGPSGVLAASGVAAMPADWARAWLARWLPHLLTLWGLGLGLRGAALLGGWRLLRRVRREAWPAGEPWQGRLEALAARLGLKRAPLLWVSSRAAVPMVVGWLRPMMVLPSIALTGLSPAQLEMVLAHELAHLRRCDAWVNAAQVAIETLLYYHPAVAWMSRRVRAEREHCCDDAVVALMGDALAYARTLTRLETLRQPSSLLLAATGGVLMSRVVRLVGPVPKRPASGLLLPLLTLGLLLAACTTLRSERGGAGSLAGVTVCVETEVKTGMHAIPAFDSASARALSRLASASGLSAGCAGEDLTVRYAMTFQAKSLSWQASLTATDARGRVLWAGSSADAIPARGAVSFQQLSESNAEKLLGDFLASRR